MLGSVVFHRFTGPMLINSKYRYVHDQVKLSPTISDSVPQVSAVGSHGNNGEKIMHM